MTKKSKPIIIDMKMAGRRHQVATVLGGNGNYCREPCAECPWRKDMVGNFPAEAFKHSANTAYDMAERTFACHVAGKDNPTTCAGFLMRGAVHNMTVRVKRMQGLMLDVTDGGHELHKDYRAMAIANGVKPNDPHIADCRGN